MKSYFQQISIQYFLTTYAIIIINIIIIIIIIIIISLLMSPLLGHRPSLWITQKENGP
jgi:hypothetical protein